MGLSTVRFTHAERKNAHDTHEPDFHFSFSFSLSFPLVGLMRPCAFTVCASFSAVICMNHLKRLTGGGGGGVWLASAQLDKVADFVCVYVRAIDSGMGTMSAKHVALAVNALVPTCQV